MKRIIRVLLIISLFFMFSNNIYADEEYYINKISINSFIKQVDYYDDRYEIKANYQIELRANNDLESACFDLGDFTGMIANSNHEYSDTSLDPDFFKSDNNKRKICFKNIVEGINQIEFSALKYKKCSYGECSIDFIISDEQANYYLTVESDHRIEVNNYSKAGCNSNTSSETDKYYIVSSLCSLNNIQIIDYEREKKVEPTNSNNNNNYYNYNNNDYSLDINNHKTIIYVAIQIIFLISFIIYVYGLYPKALNRGKDIRQLIRILPFLSGIVSIILIGQIMNVVIFGEGFLIFFIHFLSFFICNFIEEKNVLSKDGASTLIIIVILVCFIHIVNNCYNNNLFSIVVISNLINQIIMGIIYRINIYRKGGYNEKSI